MISKFLTKVTSYLSENKALFIILLTGSVIFLINGILKIDVSESIFDTLPKGSSFTTFQKLIADAKLDSKVVFSIDVPENGDVDELYERVTDFEERLKANAGSYLTNIQAFRENVQPEVVDFILTNLPLLTDTLHYAYFEQRTHFDSIRKSVSDVRYRLKTPEATWIKELVLKDPIGISYPVFKELASGMNTLNSHIENDMLLINQGKQVLITAQTNFLPGDSRAETALFDSLEVFQANWNALYPEHQMHYFGGFALAAGNAQHIKMDSFRTLAMALVLILGLLWLYYRNLKTSLIILLPAAFGGLFAVGILGYIKPDISGISLATGAVLLGIALDYSIHFVSHFKHTGSVSRTIQDIAKPLITGSLTTILAYSALIFANSELLNDFGIFAGLALSSALVFTLIGLPVIISLLGIQADQNGVNKPLFAIPEVPRKYGLPVLASIGALTLFFYLVTDEVQFDGDPRNISIQTESLRNAERLLTPIDPEKDIQLYVFTSNQNPAAAADANYLVYRKLLELNEKELVKTFNSAAPFFVSEKLSNLRRIKWENYWSQNSKNNQVIHALHRSADENGFSPQAFQFFENLLTEPTHELEGLTELLKGLGIDNLVQENDDKVTFITTLVVPKENIEQVKASLDGLDHVQLFYRIEMIESLLEMVQEDFNYILFVSAGIVFLALLLLYGRLELALLSFLPMAISWIWILGITVLLDIKFNFVNVIFATFIFGLGDDFSIFMTDGLLQRYRLSRNKLTSYSSAISLSGLTVLIGTGVLLFATHPALRSVAVVSVPGILCIVLVSLVFQPIMFGLFVQNRVDQGRTPISIWTFLKTWFCFGFFVCMCYLAFLIMLVLIILPIPTRKKKEWLAAVMSKLATAVMISGTQIRKRTYGREHLDYSKPVILIANHSSFLDIMIMLMHHPKAVIMVKEWVYKSPLYGWVIRYLNYIFMEEGPEANIEQARQLVADGYSIIIFPEGTRSEDGHIRRFHKGAFLLAEQLNLAIQPVFIHGAGYVSPKNELVIKHGPVNVGIQPRIEPDDLSWGVGYRERTKSISRYFKTEFEKFKKEMDDTRFMKQRIFNNYIFKGPVLEWYFRIKWELEKKNYEHYDQLIGERKSILDLGCGYGFLDFYLHYRDESRTIIGVDYDEEKIGIAANSYGKTDNLQFVQADVVEYDFKNQDVIFLTDLLHYLSESDQKTLLSRCIEKLNPGGLIFIRDGITDNGNAHQYTKLTEWLSTQLFAFNKKRGNFHFFSKDEIRQIAAQKGLELEECPHSKRTSNTLFILSKPH